MVTYTCDRCGVRLNCREDEKGGAHRLLIRDVIPWSPTADHSATERMPTTVDLCGKCNAGLIVWIAGNEGAASSSPAARE